jgi:hypothetical protein
MMFCRAKVGLVSLVRNCLNEFRVAFGLSHNLDKSSMFCVMLSLILNYNFLMLSATRKGSCQLGILVFLLLLQSFS